MEYATSASAVAFGGAYTVFKHGSVPPFAVEPVSSSQPLSFSPLTSEPQKIVVAQNEIITPTTQPIIVETTQDTERAERQRMLEKVQRFDEDLEGDLWLSESEWETLKSVHKKIAQVKNYVGYGHFNILSFDQMLKYAKNVSSIQAFTKDELNLLEGTFYRNAQDLGFMGNKVVSNLTNEIKLSQVSKIPGSGHYLFKGE